MTVLITGNGHSGTTFIARLLMELGCDFGQGDPPATWTEGAQAMEHPDIQKASREVALAVERGEGKNGALDVILAHDPPSPSYVKAPAVGWYLDIWLAAGFDFTSAVICHRDIGDTVRSIVQKGGGYGGFGPLRDDDATRDRLYRQTGRMMSALWSAWIPHMTIMFPECLERPMLIYPPLVVVGVIDRSISERAFIEAHRKVAKPELVHFR